MNKRKFLILLVIFSYIFAMTGCSASIEEEISQAKKQVETAFKSKPIEPNEKAKLFSFYLPGEFELEQELNNNVILKQGRQTFILFVNPKENLNSQLMYETLVKNSSKNMLKSTFIDKERFGYVSVKSVGESLYEISVGIGGIKMTTETKAKNVAKNAEEMMKIVTSVQINK